MRPSVPLTPSAPRKRGPIEADWLSFVPNPSEHLPRSNERGPIETLCPSAIAVIYRHVAGA
jgi:hypothetical protein